MKRILYGLLVLVLLVGGTAYAESLLPDDAQEFTNDCGYVCYVWPDGSGDCYPCIGGECEIETTPTATVPPPDSTPTPRPEPTTKPKCNRGLGNGAEGCDPGNSGGKPGSAGEGNE